MARQRIDWGRSDRLEILRECCEASNSWNGVVELFRKRTGILATENSIRLRARMERYEIQDKLLGADHPPSGKKSLFDLVLEMAEQRMEKLPRLRRPPARKRKKSKHETAVAVWSDFHVGAWVDPESTGSLCNYSWDVFHTRFRELLDVQLKLRELKNAYTRTPSLWILMLGDMVDGSGIYPGHAWHKDPKLSVFAQALNGGAVIADGLHELSRHYRDIHVACVPGNHGRVGRKGDLPHDDNLDNLLYRVVQERLAKVKHIHFHISDKTPWGVANIGGYNFAYTHGDQVRGSMGIPFYGIARAVGRILSMIEKPLEAFLLGHHHNFCEFDVNEVRCICNGSLVGGSDLSTNRMFLASRPKQIFLHVHPEHGITDTWRMTLGEKPVLEERENAVLTPTRGEGSRDPGRSDAPHPDKRKKKSGDSNRKNKKGQGNLKSKRKKGNK